MSHFINKNQKRQFIWRDDLFIWGLLPGVKAWFWSNHFLPHLLSHGNWTPFLETKQNNNCWCTQRNKHFSTVSLFELQPVSKLKFMLLISMLSLYSICMEYLKSHSWETRTFYLLFVGLLHLSFLTMAVKSMILLYSKFTYPSPRFPRSDSCALSSGCHTQTSCSPFPDTAGKRKQPGLLLCDHRRKEML